MNINRILIAMTCLAILQLGATCSSSETTVIREGPSGPGYGYGGGGGYQPPPPVYVQEPGPIYTEPPGPIIVTRPPPPMVYQPGYRWPRETVLVRQGQGRLQWEADGYGAVYVVDADFNRVIAAFEVTRGQWVSVLPAQDRIYVNDTAVYVQNLRGDALHQILYDRGRNLPGTGPVPNDDWGRGGRGGGWDGRGGGGGRGGIDTSPGWPASARVVTSGGDRQTWRTTANGTVYIVDSGQNRLIARFEVTRGQNIEVRPGDDRVLVDGRTITHQNLRREAGHQILFDGPDSGGGGGAGRGDSRGGGGGGRGGIDTSPGWPASARAMASGADRQTWRATANGTIYIVDSGQNRLIARFEVTRGQTIEVQPGNDRVIVDGRTITHQNLRREAGHQILFDGPADAGGGGSGGGAGRGDGRSGGNPPVPTTPFPRDAERVADSVDRLTWRATANGDVYVIDAGQNRLIIRVPIKAGQTLVLQPNQDRILLDSRVIYDQNLRAEARHQFYFDRSR